MSLESPLSQTFGVEIECIAKCSPLQVELAKMAVPPQRFQQARRGIVNAIYSLFMAAQIPINNPLETYGVSNYLKWSIWEDASIREGEEDLGWVGTYQYFGLEIISRVLQPDAEGLQEVFNVLDILSTQFNLITNRSTGLHVHVGNGTEGFPLPTLKKLAQLVTGFEHIIHSLHPDYRLEEREVSRFCEPPSESRYLQSQNPFEKMLCIEEVDSLEEFLEVMNPGMSRAFAYNFQNLDPWEESGSKTIEFRQHAGTVNAAEIIAWIEFMTGLVSFSHEVSSVQHIAICMARVTDDKFSILDLMKLIGKKHLVEYYRDRFHMRQRPDIIVNWMETVRTDL